MMAWLRSWLRIVRVTLHVASGLVIVATVFRRASGALEERLIRWWSRRLLTILGVRVRVIAAPDAAADRVAVIRDALRGDRSGDERSAGPSDGGSDAGKVRGAMLVMNHVSWLDIFVVHSLRPAHFIAKKEISRWPLLGYLVARTGTIFIERGKRHAVREINHRIAATLEAGGLVGLFPEGTTGDGERLLPFHANLVQPAIRVGASIVVAGIRYRDPCGGPTNATLYVGDTTIVESLFRIARGEALVAELYLIDALDGAATTRHDAGQAARARIAAALGLDDDAREAAEDLSTVIVVPDGPVLSPARALADTALGTSLDPRDELL